MSKVLVSETNLTAIADAIRAKNNSTNLYKPGEMPAAIASITTGGSDKLPEVIDGTVVELTAADFGDATTIKQYTFDNCSSLTKVVLPDTITKISNGAFTNCRNLKECRMSLNITNIYDNVFSSSIIEELTFGPNIPTLTNSSFSNMAKLTKLYVPGEAYDNYIDAPVWGGAHLSKLTPNSEYVNKLPATTLLMFNATKTLTVDLVNYDVAPTGVTITSSDPSMVVISNSTITSTQISFTIQSQQTEGTAKITLSVPGANGHTFIRECSVNILAEIPESTYTIETPTDCTYGFVPYSVGDAGFYTSTNENKDNSFSYAKINISNLAGRMVYIDYNQSSEKNYDYALISNVNQEISKNTADGAYKYSLKGVETTPGDYSSLEYPEATGNCFITLKYKKDTSGRGGTDTFIFRVRFED